jgi:protein-L-isoaspartate O-methyltransferase
MPVRSDLRHGGLPGHAAAAPRAADRGGRLIAPVVEGTRQRFTLLEKTADGIRRTIIADVLYVSLQGRHGA